MTENDYLYFCYSLKMNSKEYYFIWASYEGEEDRNDKVLTKGKGILSFTDKEKCLKYAEKTGIDVVEEGEDDVLFSLNVRKKFRYKNRKKDCEYFIKIWNLVSDINYSFGRMTIAECRNDETDVLYDKMFWGLNLPVVTPEGEEWIPVFTNREEKLIRSLHKTFLRTLRKYLI